VWNNNTNVWKMYITYTCFNEIIIVHICRTTIIVHDTWLYEHTTYSNNITYTMRVIMEFILIHYITWQMFIIGTWLYCIENEIVA